MDGSRFDQVVMSLAKPGSRRRLLGGLAGGALALAGLRSANAAVCRPAGRTCREHADCCAELCGPKNGRGNRHCAARLDLFVSAFAGQDGIGLPTGIVLTPGHTATISAVDAGATCFVSGGGCENGPNGNQPNTSPAALAPQLVVYSLIARVGAGPWVFIGEGPTVITGTGQLYLAYNDGNFSDNGGGFLVTILTV